MLSFDDRSMQPLERFGASAMSRMSARWLVASRSLKYALEIALSSWKSFSPEFRDKCVTQIPHLL